MQNKLYLVKTNEVAFDVDYQMDTYVVAKSYADVEKKYPKAIEIKLVQGTIEIL